MSKIILLLSAFMLSSCSHTLFHAPVIASTTANGIPEYKELGQVTERGCAIMFLGFGKPLDYKKMYEKAMQSADELGGDALVDFQVKSDGFTFIYPLFMRDCWAASGQAVKFTSGSSAWTGETADPEAAPVKSKWDVESN